MGAPTLSILAETYIQHIEHKQIYQTLIKQQIITYFRYVDDILMIYYQRETNIEHTLDKINKLQPFIKFTTEKELHKSINFLDLTINRKDRNLQFAIYRKPTQTDIIIPNSSCHPYEHKLSGINYLLNRLHTYQITEKAKYTERNAIKNMLRNNEYNTDIIRKLPQKQNTHTDLHIQWQRSKKDYETFAGHASKNSLPYTEHNAKYIKAPGTKR
jgi:hypothetical protein